jgi:hypothetical protein
VPFENVSTANVITFLRMNFYFLPLAFAVKKHPPIDRW